MRRGSFEGGGAAQEEGRTLPGDTISACFSAPRPNVGAKYLLCHLLLIVTMHSVEMIRFPPTPQPAGKTANEQFAIWSNPQLEW